MKACKYPSHRLLVSVAAILTFSAANAQEYSWQYSLSIPQPSSHEYHVELNLPSFNSDTVTLKMPVWMPGYYQFMPYAGDVQNLVAKDAGNKTLVVTHPNDHTWKVVTKKKPVTLSYDIQTHRKFVAISYVDSAHAYIIPENTFLYSDGHLRDHVSVEVAPFKDWKNIATGLDPVAGKNNEFNATDFDILYDCPLLIGNLEQLPSFFVNGVEHRFIGYGMGDFDRKLFMQNLQKVVQAAVNIIGEVPYKQYTFLAIGPGRGGIEHLDNTTVSFDGSQMNTPEGMNKMMNFLAHEYFHNFNVKRIRPVELGPFDYEHGSKTNLLWVSEGLTVYYEYTTVKRAGLVSDSTYLADFQSDINNLENNPGREYESLVQSSYNTWTDGPFGDKGKTISYYVKGPVVGLLLDFAIREDTQGKRSLDDVMRLLYYKYYKTLHRGFTDAEFQEACEEVAGTPLSDIFEYVYTTKELDYNRWLNPGGLNLEEVPADKTDRYRFILMNLAHPDSTQNEIRAGWLGGNR